MHGELGGEKRHASGSCSTVYGLMMLEPKGKDLLCQKMRLEMHKGNDETGEQTELVGVWGSGAWGAQGRSVEI